MAKNDSQDKEGIAGLPYENSTVGRKLHIN